MSPLKKVSESVTAAPIALNELIREALQNYFAWLDGQAPANLYDLVLAEVEKPLFEMILMQTKGNKTKASQLLGLNRGTFAKKLQQYQLD